MTNPSSICNHTKKRARGQYGRVWEQVQEIFADFLYSALSRELQTVFDNLHDGELIEVLEKERWTGRSGFPIRVMWHTIIASHVLDIHTIQELIRRLSSNPLLLSQCGISSPTEVPSRFAYYRFTKKLMAHQDLIERCMAKTVEALRRQRPGFGQIVVTDSTDIESYVDWSRKPLSDPDARWGWRKNKNDEEEMYPGYKMHLLCDAQYEIGLLPIITPANENDSPLMTPLLQKNKALIGNFSPKFVLGDSGYDAVNNYRTIVEDFKAVPIIDLNLRRRKGKPARFEDIADEYGTPYCAFSKEYVFWGYDSKQKRLKYRCPLAVGKKGCSWVEKCSKSPYGQVIKLKLSGDYRRFIRVPRHTKRWKEMYRKRTSLERVFSALKKNGDGKLVNHRIRGLEKITLNSLLAVWVSQAKEFG